MKTMIKTSKPRRDGMVRVTFTLPLSEPAFPPSPWSATSTTGTPTRIR